MPQTAIDKACGTSLRQAPIGNIVAVESGKDEPAPTL